MPAYNTAALQHADHRHHLHPFTNHPQLHAKGARIVTRAENIYIYDSDDKKYLDAMSGLWCVNIGYGRDELAEVAREQMRQLPYYNSFFQTAQLPAVALSEMLAEVTPPQYKRVFFGCSGSDSVDTVVRLARYYWQLKGQPSRNIIISRKNAYHGSTMAGASLGGMAFMHAIGGIPIPDVEHIAEPYHYAAGGKLDADAFGLQVAQELESRIKKLGADRVAAFIGEPIQGAGGVIIPPQTYWPEVQRICRKYDVLLIVDEVICGFGRTGEWFGSDAFQIDGDLMTLAKGLSSGYQPIGAVMVGDKVADALNQDAAEFAHGYTYSGHPVACAVALKNLQIMRDERIIETARDEVMDYLQKQIRTLGDHALVGEVRGKGFLGAIEIVADKKTRKRFDGKGRAGIACREACLQNGLVMRAVGDIMVLSPPLIISRAQVDELVSKARASFDQAQRELTA